MENVRSRWILNYGAKDINGNEDLTKWTFLSHVHLRVRAARAEFIEWLI